MAAVLSTHLGPESSSDKIAIQEAVLEIQSPRESNKAKNDDLLVVSPYDEEPHLLDLKTLDIANQLLAKALVGLKCLRDDYATAPYVDSFNVSRHTLDGRKSNLRCALIYLDFFHANHTNDIFPLANKETDSL